MILGLGSDLVDMRRIQKALIRYGDRFSHRLFTAEERADAESSFNPAAVYAKRFAAKEAAAKALGVGIYRGIAWCDIAVTHNSSGMPILILSDGAEKRLRAMTPEGTAPHIAVSLSDEPPFAQAVVIISGDHKS